MRKITKKDIHLVPGDIVTPPALGARVRIMRIDIKKQRVHYRYINSPRGRHEWETGICVIAGIRNCE